MSYTDAEKADLLLALDHVSKMKRSELVSLFQRNSVPFKEGSSAEHLRSRLKGVTAHFIIERMASRPQEN